MAVVWGLQELRKCRSELVNSHIEPPEQFQLAEEGEQPQTSTPFPLASSWPKRMTLESVTVVLLEPMISTPVKPISLAFSWRTTELGDWLIEMALPPVLVMLERSTNKPGELETYSAEDGPST